MDVKNRFVFLQMGIKQLEAKPQLLRASATRRGAALQAWLLSPASRLKVSAWRRSVDFRPTRKR